MGYARRRLRNLTVHYTPVCDKCGKQHMKFYKEIYLVKKNSLKRGLYQNVLYCSKCGHLLQLKVDKDQL